MRNTSETDYDRELKYNHMNAQYGHFKHTFSYASVLSYNRPHLVTVIELKYV